MKHDNAEGEMERYDMRTAITLSHACWCLHVTQGKCKENVRATRSVCTTSVPLDEMWNDAASIVFLCCTSAKDSPTSCAPQ